jgi:hypothetical protein
VKAILHSQYGASDLLQFKEIDKPAPKDDEILIAIHATTVSTADCNMRNFTFVTRSMLPFATLALKSESLTWEEAAAIPFGRTQRSMSSGTSGRSKPVRNC